MASLSSLLLPTITGAASGVNGPVRQDMSFLDSPAIGSGTGSIWAQIAKKYGTQTTPTTTVKPPTTPPKITDPWQDPTKPPDYPLAPGGHWSFHDGRWWTEFSGPDTTTTGTGTSGTSGTGGTGSGGSGLPSVNTGFGNPGGAFNLADFQFDDPDTLRMLQFITQRVGQLTTPANDPTFDDYIRAAQNYSSQLRTPFTNPETAGFTNAARTLATSLSTPWTNPQAGKANAVLDQILKDATAADPFSSSQLSSMKAEAFAQIEQDRAAALRQEQARLAMAGHGRESGTMAEATRQINAQYDRLRAEKVRQLALEGITQANTNQVTATNIPQILRDLAQNDQKLNENRAGAGVDLLSAIRDAVEHEQSLNEARSGTGVGVLKSVTDAQAAQRAEAEARLDKALTLMSLPVQLSDSRLQNAMAVLGLTSGQTNPLNIFNSLAGLSTNTANTASANRSNDAQFWQSLGMMLPTIINSFQKPKTTTGGTS